jgi:hypothetical protein
MEGEELLKQNPPPYIAVFPAISHPTMLPLEPMYLIPPPYPSTLFVLFAIVELRRVREEEVTERPSTLFMSVQEKMVIKGEDVS